MKGKDLSVEYRHLNIDEQIGTTEQTGAMIENTDAAADPTVPSALSHSLEKRGQHVVEAFRQNGACATPQGRAVDRFHRGQREQRAVNLAIEIFPRHQESLRQPRLDGCIGIFADGKVFSVKNLTRG